jgi:hypothetical protein
VDHRPSPNRNFENCDGLPTESARSKFIFHGPVWRLAVLLLWLTITGIAKPVPEPALRS